MHGTAPFLRNWLLTARPWQRLVVACAMVGAGVLLVTLGHARAALVGAAGLLIVFGMVRNGLRARNRRIDAEQHPSSVPTDGERS